MPSYHPDAVAHPARRAEPPILQGAFDFACYRRAHMRLGELRRRHLPVAGGHTDARAPPTRRSTGIGARSGMGTGRGPTCSPRVLPPSTRQPHAPCISIHATPLPASKILGCARAFGAACMVGRPPPPWLPDTSRRHGARLVAAPARAPLRRKTSRATAAHAATSDGAPPTAINDPLRVLLHHRSLRNQTMDPGGVHNPADTPNSQPWTIAGVSMSCNEKHDRPGKMHRHTHERSNAMRPATSRISGTHEALPSVN